MSDDKKKAHNFDIAHDEILHMISMKKNMLTNFNRAFTQSCIGKNI